MVSSELVGAEALARWIHPVDGIRPPAAFIPLFEKNGFISQLDLYMFEETCRIKSTWKGTKYEHIPISINMSRLHLYNQAYPDQLVEIAGRYQIPTNELELEVTESIFLKDSTELIRMINQLQDRGFMISIDDFGSGFSALNLLKDLNANTIKLDREFLSDSSNSTRGKKIIRNVIALCLDLKMDVVTEGIETKDQIDFITRCGCQIGQGYYYAKPLCEKDFVTFAEEYLTNIRDSFVFHLDGDPKVRTAPGRGFSAGINRLLMVPVSSKIPNLCLSRGVPWRKTHWNFHRTVLSTTVLLFPSGCIRKNFINGPLLCMLSLRQDFSASFLIHGKATAISVSGIPKR